MKKKEINNSQNQTVPQNQTVSQNQTVPRDIFQNYKRNRTILEKFFKEGKNLDSKLVESYWKKIKYPHRKNPESEHLLSIYFKNYKKLDPQIVKILLNGYKNINHKSFKNHPLIVAIRQGHIEILPLLLSRIDLFQKTSKTNNYLLSDVYQVFGERDISEILEKYTRSKTDFFKFLFRNKYIHDSFFKIEYSRKFISEIVKEKIKNKKDFYSLNEFLSRDQKLIIYDENNFLNVTDPSETGKNYGTFLLSNYLNTQFIPNIGFNFKDNILVPEINDTFTREKISHFLNEIKIRMIDFYGICENFVTDTRQGTFDKILEEIIKRVIGMEDIFDLEEPDKNLFIELSSKLFSYEILWFIRDKIEAIKK